MSAESNFTHLYFAHALRVTDTDKTSVAVTNDVDENEKHFGRNKQIILSPAKLGAFHQTSCAQKAVTLERRGSLTNFLF